MQTLHAHQPFPVFGVRLAARRAFCPALYSGVQAARRSRARRTARSLADSSGRIGSPDRAALAACVAFIAADFRGRAFSAASLRRVYCVSLHLAHVANGFPSGLIPSVTGWPHWTHWPSLTRRSYLRFEFFISPPVSRAPCPPSRSAALRGGGNTEGGVTSHVSRLTSHVWGAVTPSHCDVTGHVTLLPSSMRPSAPCCPAPSASAQQLPSEPSSERPGTLPR